MDIPPDWKPTSANINALPMPLRGYIHELETSCDPAGLLRENMQLKDQIAALQIMYRKAVGDPE